MKRRKIFWQLYFSYVFILLITLLLISWHVTSSFKQFHLKQTREYLTTSALLASINLKPAHLLSKNLLLFQKKHSKDKTIRFTFMDSLGNVLMDSEKDPLKMDNHKSRPEVIQAIMGIQGYSVRYSRTLRKNMMYVALPLKNNSQHHGGVIRAALPLTVIEQELSFVYQQFILMGFFLVTAIGLFSYWLSRKWSRPLERMKQVADEFSLGNFSSKLPDSKSEEIHGLGIALHKMAEDISLRIQTTERQKIEQEAILASLIEGVIATDENQVIFRINQAACQLFQISSPQEAIGNKISDIIRHPQLLKMIQQLEHSTEVVAGELDTNWNKQTFLNVYARHLKMPEDQASLTLFVFHDVTSLKKMETMRKDFVANVSHELKTPITSIKGFVETLLGGAINDPIHAEKFLQIILKQSDNLKLIVEELLTLSKIEQAENNLEKEESLPEQLLNNIVEYYTPEATEKRVTLKIECQAQSTWLLNSRLIEQALSNLLQNAIRYNEEGTTVIIGARLHLKELELYIKDNGPGIPAEHQSRLFERFYRLDKSRSREGGGTGLGLAIVKHIAQAHAGRVSLKSDSKNGSTFSIFVPRSS